MSSREYSVSADPIARVTDAHAPMLEDGTGMECLSTCEKAPRNQDRSLVASVSLKHGIVLMTYMFVPLLGIANSSGFDSDYASPFPIVVQRVFPSTACSWELELFVNVSRLTSLTLRVETV